ncbi:serine/threonine protein phosphatase [Ahniella affigens]|uniref:Serine/threonine protein phosphatase n=1 Tax=Ahniella affigens TaxID=2021234 RepID=A0A2P1PQ66_9GAMM|nr:phosphatase PAP2/dual specificity phosphatase family protein [Ahniella affigens]AVP96985.1 serine/threonine protein phosphatase [Ahniella affigens]
MRHWRLGAKWLAFLGPFFYVTYGLSNYVASLREPILSFVMAWERHVPFLAWTIIPYWSINLFYGLSLFLARSEFELGRHARRLLTAQVIAVTCFLLFPMKATFAKPETDGLAGFMFEALGSFDKPYNQWPSLHIALLMILWDFYRRLLPPWAKPVLHAWALLIAGSVLTTYQHHAIDVPTGAMLGLICLWLWPLDLNTPRPQWQGWQGGRAGWFAAAYATGAAACLCGALLWPRHALILIWPALALLLVALAYAGFGVGVFQKSGDGRVSLAATWLLAPHRLGAFINSRLWTLGGAAAVPVTDRLWVGRWPDATTRGQFEQIIDLTAELPQAGAAARALPALDLLPLSMHTLQSVSAEIDLALSERGRVLVCCALGYSRSSAAVLAWLRTSGRVGSFEQAFAELRAKRPELVLGAEQLAALRALPAP